MASNPKIQIDILADSSGARKEFDKAGDSADKFGDKFSKGLGKASDWSGGALLAMGGFGVAAAAAATDAELAATSVDRAFGTDAGAVHAFAETAADTVGVSAAEYEALAATFGTAVQGMGLTADEAATKTDGLLVAAGDLALAAGTDVPTAASALGGALRGEFDSLSEFGVKIDEATVLAGLAAKGITDPATGLTPAIGSAQYQQELLNQVMGLAGTTYSGYRAETDTTAERTQNMTGKFGDATAELGEALLPAVGWVADKLVILAGYIQDNKDALFVWIPWVAGAATAIWLLNWALAANPIILFTLAIAIAVGAIIIFRDQIMSFINGALRSLDNALSSPDWWGTQLQEALGALGLAGEDFRTTINNISTALSGLWGWFQRNWSLSLPSVPLAPAATRAAPSGFAAVPGGAGLLSARSLSAGPAAAAAAAGTQITIQVGVGDPDAIARTIQRVLGGRARRSGPVNI